ncbi:MarC family protein [Empedobacter sedimenti]|uniref:MarC family protein n=1 Tax=Empedobacter sedimenti TaxID=3042610 RepID=UPI0024A63F87|nr:MarC family protein [Empedobacter sedimenti]
MDSITSFFQKFSINQIGTTFAVLFAVIDIVGSIPIIVSIRSKVGHIQSRKASLAAGILLISFLFFGTKILKLIGVDVQSFAIAGAFVIFIIAVEMILGIEIQKGVEAKSASIVPIAFPLVAGAGSLTTVLSLRSQFADINIVIAIILNMLIVYLVLKFAGTLEKWMGPGVLSVLKKVFGVILLSIAIKLFTSNIGALFMNEIKI